MIDGSTLTEDRAIRPGPPEAVIREARRRQRRRRWLVAGLVTIPVVALVAAGLVAVSHPGQPPRPIAHRPHGKDGLPADPLGAIEPTEPGPVTVAPDGTLYVDDDAQNRILARQPDGRFRVVAGNGTKGFSGDGGPAVDASLGDPQGLAVDRNGTIYVADFANNRIRAVSSAGIITTIAGNGQDGPAPNGVPAISAPVGEPTAVTIGPDGMVYIASYSAGILRVDLDGALTVIGNGTELDAADPSVMLHEQCSPASLTFDRAGNLYIGCSSPWVLLERTPDGTLHFIGQNRPHDAWAALTVPSHGGGVLAVVGAAIVAYGSAGPPINVDFLTYRLPGGRPFWPQGIASDAGGLYLTQDGVSGIGPAAILRLSDRGAVTVLWQARASTAPR